MFDYVVDLMEREDMSPIHAGLADVTFRGRRVHGLRSAQRRALVVAHAAELAAFDTGAYVTITPGTQYLGAGDYAPVVSMARI